MIKKISVLLFISTSLFAGHDIKKLLLPHKERKVEHLSTMSCGKKLAAACLWTAAATCMLVPDIGALGGLIGMEQVSSNCSMTPQYASHHDQAMAWTAFSLARDIIVISGSMCIGYIAFRGNSDSERDKYEAYQ